MAPVQTQRLLNPGRWDELQVNCRLFQVKNRKISQKKSQTSHSNYLDNFSSAFFLFQLIHHMKRANFSALGEKINFDQNGDPIAYYDLLNWQKRPDGSQRLAKVGFYDASSAAGRSLVINDSVIQWPVGKQVCSLQTGLRPCSLLRLLFVQLINTSANLFLLLCNIINATENKVSPSNTTY